MNVFYVFNILFLAASLELTSVHAMTKLPETMIELPETMNSDDASEFIAKIIILSDEQITKCLNAMPKVMRDFRVMELSKHEAWFERYQEYQNNLESIISINDDDFEDDFLIDMQLFQTIDGFAAQMKCLEQLKTNDFKKFEKVLKSTEAELKTIICVWFFCKRVYKLEPAIIEQRLNAIESKRLQGFAREALWALSTIKGAGVDFDSIVQILILYRQDAIKFNFLRVFLKTSDDPYLSIVLDAMLSTCFDENQGRL